jgi:hypothetical protein
MARFRILPGLLGTGPPHIPFPPKGKAEYSECFVVQFFPNTRPAWIGNFASGWSASSLTGVYDCFEGPRALVISGGSVWDVDPENPASSKEIDTWTKSVIEVPEHKRLVLVNLISFLGVGPEGLAWKSRRISLDGFRALSVADQFLAGESWTPIDEKWVPFRLNVLTGEHEGGAYTLGDM